MIKIEEKIGSKAVGTTTLYISFNYHPDIVEIVK